MAKRYSKASNSSKIADLLFKSSDFHSSNAAGILANTQFGSAAGAGAPVGPLTDGAITVDHAIKCVGKKNTITREKGVKKLYAAVVDARKDERSDLLDALLLRWPSLYAAIALDSSRTLRMHAGKLFVELFAHFDKSQLADSLTQTLPQLLCATGDSERAIAELAQSVCKSLVTQDDLQDNCKAIVFWCWEQMFEQTPESMSDPRMFSETEREQKYVNVYTGCIWTLQYLCRKLASFMKLKKYMLKMWVQQKFWDLFGSDALDLAIKQALFGLVVDVAELCRDTTDFSYAPLQDNLFSLLHRQKKRPQLDAIYLLAGLSALVTLTVDLEAPVFVSSRDSFESIAKWITGTVLEVCSLDAALPELTRLVVFLADYNASLESCEAFLAQLRNWHKHNPRVFEPFFALYFYAAAAFSTRTYVQDKLRFIQDGVFSVIDKVPSSIPFAARPIQEFDDFRQIALSFILESAAKSEQALVGSVKLLLVLTKSQQALDSVVEAFAKRLVRLAINRASTNVRDIESVENILSGCIAAILGGELSFAEFRNDLRSIADACVKLGDLKLAVPAFASVIASDWPSFQLSSVGIGLTFAAVCCALHSMYAWRCLAADDQSKLVSYLDGIRSELVLSGAVCADTFQTNWALLENSPSERELFLGALKHLLICTDDAAFGVSLLNSVFDSFSSGNSRFTALSIAIICDRVVLPLGVKLSSIIQQAPVDFALKLWRTCLVLNSELDLKKVQQVFNLVASLAFENGAADESVSSTFFDRASETLSSNIPSSSKLKLLLVLFECPSVSLLAKKTLIADHVFSGSLKRALEAHVHEHPTLLFTRFVLLCDCFCPSLAPELAWEKQTEIPQSLIDQISIASSLFETVDDFAADLVDVEKYLPMIMTAASVFENTEYHSSLLQLAYNLASRCSQENVFLGDSDIPEARVLLLVSSHTPGYKHQLVIRANKLLDTGDFINAASLLVALKFILTNDDCAVFQSFGARVLEMENSERAFEKELLFVMLSFVPVNNSRVNSLKLDAALVQSQVAQALQSFDQAVSGRTPMQEFVHLRFVASLLSQQSGLLDADVILKSNLVARIKSKVTADSSGYVTIGYLELLLELLAAVPSLSNAFSDLAAYIIESQLVDTSSCDHDSLAFYKQQLYMQIVSVSPLLDSVEVRSTDRLIGFVTDSQSFPLKILGYSLLHRSIASGKAVLDGALYYSTPVGDSLGFFLKWLLLLQVLPSSEAADQDSELDALLETVFSVVAENECLWQMASSPLAKCHLPDFNAEFLIDYDEYLAFGELNFAAYLLYQSLMRRPRCVQKHIEFKVASNGVRSTVSAFIKRYISSAIIAETLDVVEREFTADSIVKANPALAQADLSSMALKVNRYSRELRLDYCLEDSPISLSVKLPPLFPLLEAEIDSQSNTSRGTVDEKKWRMWLLQLKKILAQESSAASLVRAFTVWLQTVSGWISGVSDCSICYSIVNSEDRSLPTSICSICKNYFHGRCLFKWFRTSNQSNCPLCRNLFQQQT